MKQTSHVMLISDPLHCLHDKLVMVNRNVRCLIDRGQLMLCGRNLIMLRLCRHAELPQFDI